MPSKLFLLATQLSAVPCAAGQIVSSAFCGQDGNAHVEYADHSTRTIDPENEQVGCADLSISEDRKSFGWSVQFGNCCTSYPIALAVVVVRDGNKAVFQPGQMVWRWRFIERGTRVAILSGPVHGNASEAHLYDVQSQRELETWAGSGEAPAWADAWQDQFGSDTDEP